MVSGEFRFVVCLSFRFVDRELKTIWGKEFVLCVCGLWSCVVGFHGIIFLWSMDFIGNAPVGKVTPLKVKSVKDFVEVLTAGMDRVNSPWAFLVYFLRSAFREFEFME